MERYAEMLNHLKKGKCVVVIGPELCQMQADFPSFFENMYQTSLITDNDGMVLFSKKSDKLRYIHALEKFYETYNPSSELLEKIACLPTHIIVSATPDYLLPQTLEKMGFPYQFVTYHKLENPKEIEKPTVEKPLIYNLLGEINEPQSLVLTFNDLTEFLFNVKAKHQLPNNLKVSLSQTNAFLFLGFDLEKWYMKILFYLLQLHHKDDGMAMPYTDAASVKHANTRSFYIENFDVHFFEDDAQTVVHQLYAAAQNLNCLRQTDTNPRSPLQKQAIAFLKEDNVGETIELLENYFEEHNDEMYQAMIMKSGELARLERNRHKTLITREEYQVQLNRIKDALLEFIKEMEEE